MNCQKKKKCLSLKALTPNSKAPCLPHILSGFRGLVTPSPCSLLEEENVASVIELSPNDLNIHL